MRVSMLVPLAIMATLPALAQAETGQPFRIFFDWARPDISRDGEAVLGEVLAAYRRQRPSRVMIAGHSDRSGPQAHNLAASRRRAEAVRAALAAGGIPAAAITVSAYGEARPLVPTEDGVREVQNRRVEISFDQG